MSRILCACLWLMLLSGSFFAQETAPVARRVFEMKHLPPSSSCDFKFFLHDFRTQAWEKEPNARVYVIAYNERHQAARRRHDYIQRYLDRIKDDFHLNEGIPPKSVVVVNGGYREESVAELWLVPAGASPPKPTPTYIPKKNRKG